MDGRLDRNIHKKYVKFYLVPFRIVVAILDAFHFDLSKSAEMAVLAPLEGNQTVQLQIYWLYL